MIKGWIRTGITGDANWARYELSDSAIPDYKGIASYNFHGPVCMAPYAARYRVTNLDFISKAINDHSIETIKIESSIDGNVWSSSGLVNGSIICRGRYFRFFYSRSALSKFGEGLLDYVRLKMIQLDSSGKELKLYDGNRGDIGISITGPGESDAVALDGDMALDKGLSTAVFISLFTNAMDDNGDGGCWLDEFQDSQFGSLLWTLAREKMTANITEIAKKYCEDALQWMIDDSIAKSVAVTVTREGFYALAIVIEIQRPDFTTENFKYSYNWANTIGGG